MQRSQRFATAATMALVGTMIGFGTSPSVAVTQSVGVRTLPGIVGPTNNTPTTGPAHDLVVATTSPALPGRTIEFWRFVLAENRWKRFTMATTDAAGEANISGAYLARFRWLVVARPFKGMPQIKNAMTRVYGWKTLMDENFSSPSMPDNWQVRSPRTWRPGRICTYSEPDNVTFESGNALLRVKQISSPPSDMQGSRPTPTQWTNACKDASGIPRWYSSSEITTEHHRKFSHGGVATVAAARMRFDARPGQHGVWWLQEQSKGTEIDIIESYGQRDLQIDAGVHWYRGYWSGRDWWGSDLRKVRDSSPSTWSKNYHVFSVEWTPKGYIFRIDRNVFHRSKQGLTDDPHYGVLSNWASDWEVKLRTTNSTAYTLVDWVRIWQL